MNYDYLVTVGADTSGISKEIQDAISKNDENIKIKIQCDDSQVKSIIRNLSNLKPEIAANIIVNDKSLNQLNKEFENAAKEIQKKLNSINIDKLNKNLRDNESRLLELQKRKNLTTDKKSIANEIIGINNELSKKGADVLPEKEYERKSQELLNLVKLYEDLGGSFKDLKTQTKSLGRNMSAAYDLGLSPQKIKSNNLDDTRIANIKREITTIKQQILEYESLKKEYEDLEQFLGMDRIKAPEKIKFSIDLSDLDPDKIEEVNEAIERLNNNVKDPSGKVKYFTSIEESGEKVLELFDKLSKKENFDSMSIDQISSDKDATAVLRYANAYEALGGNLKELSPHINELVSNMRELEKFSSEKGYTYTVDEFKNAFKEYNILRENGLSIGGFGIGSGDGSGSGDGFGATSEDIQKLLSLLEELKNEISSIREAFGSVDDESGIGSLLSQINQLSTAVSELGFNISINTGGGNKIALTSQATREALQKQRDAYDSLYDTLIGNYNSTNIFRGHNDKFIKFQEYGDMIDGDNMSKSLYAYKEMTNILKELASIKGIDISGWSGTFDEEARKANDALQKIISGEKEAETAASKLSDIFSKSSINLDGEALSGQISDMLSLLMKIETSLSGGLNFKDLFDTSNFEKEKTGISELTESIREIIKLINLKNEAFQLENKIVSNVSSSEVENLKQVSDILDAIILSVKQYSDTFEKINSNPIELKGLSEADISNIKSLTENIQALSSLSSIPEIISKITIPEEVAFNISLLAKAIGKLKEQFNDFPDSGIGVFSQLNELASQKDVLKDLSEVLKASSNKVKEAKKQVDKKNKYDIAREYLSSNSSDIVSSTSDYFNNKGQELLSTELKATRDGLVEIKALTKTTFDDGSVSYNNYVLTVSEDTDLLVKSMDEGSAAAQRAGELFEKTFNSIQAPSTIGDFDILKNTDDWDELIGIIQKFGIEAEEVEKIVRSVRRSGNDYLESFNVTTSDGTVRTIGRSSGEIIGQKDDIIDVGKLEERYDSLYSKLRAAKKKLAQDSKDAFALEEVRKYSEEITEIEKKLESINGKFISDDEYVRIMQKGEDYKAQIDKDVENVRNNQNKKSKPAEPRDPKIKERDIGKERRDEVDEYIRTLNALKRAEENYEKDNSESNKNLVTQLTKQVLNSKEEISSYIDSMIDDYQFKFKELGESIIKDIGKINPNSSLLTSDDKKLVEDANIADKTAKKYEDLTNQVSRYVELRGKVDAGTATRKQEDEYKILKQEIDNAKAAAADYAIDTSKTGNEIDNAAKAQERFNEELREAERLYASNNSDYFRKQIKNLEKEDEDSTKGYKNVFSDLEKDYASLQALLKKGLNTDEDVENFFNLNAQIEKAINLLKTGGGDLSLADPVKIQALEKQIENWKIANPRGAKAFEKQIESLIGKMRALGATEADIDQIRYAFKAIDIEASRTGLKGLGLIDRIKNKFKELASYLLSFASFYDFINIIRQTVSIVTELDDALTEMRKVSSEPVNVLKEYQKETFDIASNIGTTSAQLQKSTADFLRMGESLNEAKKSAEEATILMNVSEFDNIDNATDSLIAMSQAYAELDKVDIIDKLNNVGNNFSISTDGLATGLQKSAAALKTAGNDMDEAIALVTAGNAIVQDPDSVGSGVRTIALRIQGTELAKKELQELGEDTEDYIVETSSKLDAKVRELTKSAGNQFKGVSLLDSNGNYRSTYQILQDIADVYDEIVEADKSSGTNRMQGLLELLAGKNRSNIAASILQNGDLLRSVYEASQDSEGSAQKELDSYLDSVSGKLAQTQNQLQELASVSLNSEDLKMLIDLFNQLLSAVTSLIDNLGIVKTIIGAISGVVLSKNNIGILNYNSKNGFSSIFKRNKENGSQVITQDIIDSFNALSGNESAIMSQSAQDAYDIAKGYGVANKAVVDFVRQGKGGLKEYEAAMKAAGTSTSKFSSVVSSLKDIGGNILSGLVNGLASYAIAFALDGIFSWIDSQIRKSEIMIEEGQKALSSISDSVNEFNNSKNSIVEIGVQVSPEDNITNTREAISSIASRYSELKEGVGENNENISLTNDEYQEYLNISQQISKQMPNLISSYDSQGNAILNLGSNAETAAGKMLQLYEASMLSANIDVGKNLQTASNGLFEEIKQFEDANNDLSEHNNIIDSNLEFLDNSYDIFKSGERTITVQNQYLKDFEKLLTEQGIVYEAFKSSDDEYMVDSLALEAADQDTIDALNKEWNAILYNSSVDLSTQKYQNENQELANKLLIEDRFESIKGLIGDYLKTSASFDSLSSELQNSILSSINNMDVSEIEGKEILPYIYEEFIAPIHGLESDAQDALLSLFKLDKSNLNIDEYQSQVSNILSEAFDDENTQNEWKKKLGLNKEIETILEANNNLIEKYSEETENISALSISDILKLDEWAAEDPTLLWDQLIAKLDEYKTVASSVSDVKITSLFEDKEGEFTKNVDTFQSNVSSIKDALEKLKSGDYTPDDIIDIIQQFPELADQTDNLSSALNSLSATNLSSAIKSIKKEMDSVEDQTQLSSMNYLIDNYKKSFLSSIDTSILTPESLQSSYVEMLTNSGLGKVEKLVLSENFKSLKNEFADSEEGAAGLFTLIAEIQADPSLATLSIEELRSMVENNAFVAKIIIDENNIERIQSEIDRLNARSDRNTAEYEAKGKPYDDKYYNSQIKNNKELQEHLKTIKDTRYNILVALTNSKDSTDKEINDAKTAWFNAQTDYYNAVSEGNELLKSQNKLPFEKMINDMADLQSEANKLNNSLSVKQAKGIKPVVSDYQKLISNSRDQIKNLQNQNVELENQQKFLENIYGKEVVNREEYRNIQQQIEENVQTIDEARLSQDEWNESAKQLFNQKNEGLLAYDIAKSTRNAGDNYLDMLEAAKEAQEAREKGLVGTDDYKTVAKMFSPHGMDDYLNWDENYGKIQKYFTEDVSGVKKFLDDLSNKTNDAGESLASFDSETGTWTYNIDNVADSANKLGISFEAFLAIMGRLQDYGFTNDYFSSVEEGYDHIADLTMDLYEAQSKLSDLQDKKANGDETVTDAVLSQQEARINQIKQSILDSQALLSEVANRSAEQFQQQQMANITSTAQMLEQARTYKFDNEEIRKAYINDIKDKALAAGVEIPAEVFIDEYTIDENALQKWAEENETTLTPSYEMKDAETSGIKDKLTQMFEDESSSAKAIVDELSSYTEEQLSGITFGDGITDGTLPEAEGLIDKLLTQLGLGQSEAQTLIHILAELGYIEPKVEFEASTESVDTAAQEIENTPVKKVVNFVQGGISSIKQAIQSKFSPESKTVETNNVTNNTVNTSINTVNPEEPVQKAQEYANANPVNVTTQVQVTGSTETNVNGTGTITVDGNNENAKASVDAAVGYAKSQNPVMNIRGNSSLARSSADNASSYISSLSPSISINAKTNGISNAISNALNGPFSINVSARVNGIHGLSRATGTAYAGGSAVYDKWTDYRHSVGAYANGTSKNWALPNDEEALVNELGTESIVRNGRWFTIPGGAHVEQLKKNDIIFNAKQTEELIKYGKVLSGGGHGRIAHADGTAYNMIKAYAKTPTNSGSFVGSSSSSSATTQNTNAVRQNTNAQKQNTKTTKNSITSFDKFKKWLEKLKDWVEVRIQRLNDTISLNTAKSENQIGYANKNKKLDVVGSTYKKLYDNQISGAKEYEAQAGRVATNAINAKMLNGKTKADRTKRANDLIKLIKEGKINIAEYGEKEREFIQTYSEWWDKAVDLRLSAEETLKNQRDNEKQKFDNIVSEYDNLLSAIEHKANMIKQYQTLNETRGYVDSTKYFERLSAIETQNQKKLEEERSKLVAQLQQSMNSGVIKYGDERWYEMQNQINGVSEAILESATNVAELANSIRQLNWEKFDYGRDMVNRLNDEFDFMIDIMSDEEMFGKDGKITSAGLSTLAMHGSKYNVYMEQANEYAREYKKIEKELAKDPYNKTLIDRKQELIDKQRESIQAAEDEKQSMISLVEDGIDAELNALQELIDKYTESLDKAKDLYDYRNSIADQTSEISKYQKQVNAYANDMSEEGRLKYQKAQNSLKDAQKNLRESEYDRYISDQKDMLSELYDDYETILNERLTNIDELISTVITSANENKSEIVTTLQEQAAAVGYVFTDEFTKIWGENGSSAKVLSDYTSDFSNRATLLQTSIDGILGFVQKMYDTSNQNANRDISSSSSSSVDPQVTRTTTTTTSSSSSSSSNSSKPSTSQSSSTTEEKLGPVSGISGTLKKGAKNANVGELQKALKKMGYKDQYGKALIVDKWFGPKTQAALKKFQKKMGIPQTGILDAKTKAAFKKKGYARGTDWIDKDELALTQERGTEIITLPDGGMITPLKRGSGVINNPNTEKVLSLAANHDLIMDVITESHKLLSADQTSKIASAVQKIGNSAINHTYGGETAYYINNEFHLEKVQKPEEFMNWMIHDAKAQNALCDMTLAKISGKTNSFATRNKF